MKAKNLYWIVTILLIILAVTLGALIIKQKAGNNLSTLIRELIQKNTPTSSASPTPSPENLTELEKRVLDTPNASSSAQEKKAYMDLVVSISKQASLLDLSSCTPSPLVFRVELGNEVVIKNSSTNKHLLVINPKNILSIDPSSEKPYKIDFSNGAGIYGYGCDDSNRSVGVFLVSP